MILVDTSVWIDHFRKTESALQQHLYNGNVVIHPVVIGELASGNLASRQNTLRDLCLLTRIAETSFQECLHFIELHHLYGKGLGWNDLQLLASARLASVPLWSNDRRLREAAETLGLAFHSG